MVAHDAALTRRIDKKLAKRLGFPLDEQSDEQAYVDKLADLLEKAANCGCP